MRKLRPITVLKTAALTATLGAAGFLGLQFTAGAVHPVTLIGAALAALLCGIVLADDVAHAFRTARGHARAVRFRRTHGNPDGWDGGACEQYLDFTPTRRHSHRKAA